VIDTAADCEEVERYLGQFPRLSRERVQLMPQGTTQAELAATAIWLRPFAEQHGYQFCPRKQIEWYGFERGT